MTKFEEEFNYLIELSGKVLIGQVDAEAFEKNRVSFFEKYETKPQQALPVVPECVGDAIAWDEQIDNSIAETLKNVFTSGDRGLKEAGLWIKNNPEKYIIARNIGYTVAKEKRYEVVFLEDDTTRQILMENNAGYYFIEEESENYGYWKQDFTEMEIKEINEKFWQLSVPVKDEQIEVEE